MQKEPIIKKYEKDGSDYTIQYLDGSTSSYSCFADNHEQEIISTMLEQIRTRQSEQTHKNLTLKRNVSAISAITSSVIFLLSILNNNMALRYLTLISMYICLCRTIQQQKQINELKKFKMFLEMREDLDKINTSDFLRCIEFDNIYQTPLDINTLYDYKYSDVKILYKKYKGCAK